MSADFFLQEKLKWCRLKKILSGGDILNKTVPAISIVIPMFNVENYIRECLDSILAQTFTDYEVIAVDDCSTDRTCEIVEVICQNSIKER